MTAPWSRRGFLTASAGTAAALGLGTRAFAASDEFATLRAKWRTLILGEGFDPTAEPFTSRLADLGATARGLLATMAPATGSLWPDLVYADPDTDQESYSYSGNMNASCTRLNTLAQANSHDQQGVAVPSLGFTGVNFWFGGTVGTLTASDPCSVMITEKDDGTAVLAVSEPMRMRTSLTLTWRRPVATVASAPATVTSATTGSALTLAFGDLTATAGATQRITVRLG